MSHASHLSKLAADSKTVPNDTTILVHGLDACVTEAQLMNTEAQLMNVFTMFGELSALNILANQQDASVRYFTRACAEKAMHRMNGNKFGGKKVPICWGSGTLYKQPLQAQPTSSMEMQTGTRSPMATSNAAEADEAI
ncbi:hypothetical protein SETIT_3G369700v2 [Setaria italica]|uniref:RRM domain-containing protein n=2 Tax=Setaria TaxID=4554 RepID=A0A368QN62_SETIT|nr:polyadenylate-binding protein RBP45B-like [Setaria viridis]RCV19254.1 hypothetical protein SETIT_3G369700v2 [Setaria italica]TKW29309.1 hypothetical protein SEVIR_3G387200v2 [Setaria viridis]